MGALTHRQRIVLAALSAGREEAFTPVQVQKMFFLLDENIAGAIGGKQFTFEPYDYGPFDKAVYNELSNLENLGFVVVDKASRSSARQYCVTPYGKQYGNAELKRLQGGVDSYITEVADWVRKLSFAQLVGSIYKAYPHMRANSIFVEK